MNDYFEDSSIYIVLPIVIGVLAAIYFFIDAQWIHPDQYSPPATIEDAMWESRDAGDFYAP